MPKLVYFIQSSILTAGRPPEIQNDDLLSDLEVIDTCFAQDFQLFINKSGQVFIQGTASWISPDEFKEPHILEHFPSFETAISLATTIDSFAILTEKGNVYASGGAFPSNLECVYSLANAKGIAISSDSLLITTGSSLTKIGSNRIPVLLSTHGHDVVYIGTYDRSFVVLLDNGILYSMSKPKDTPQIRSNIENLYVLSEFAGNRILSASAINNEIVCIYEDGSIVLGYKSFNPEYKTIFLLNCPKLDNPEQFPVVVENTRDCIWTLTVSGDIFYFLKIYSNSDSPYHLSLQFYQMPSSFSSNIVHMRSCWKSIFFFEQGHDTAYNLSFSLINSVQKIDRPFIFNTQFYGSVLINPFGASNIGFNSGDIVQTSNGSQITVIGTSDSFIYGKGINDHIVQRVPIPDISTALFKWKLIERKNSSLKDIVLKEGKTLQIDCSSNALSKICFFKAGDEIENEMYGHGIIIGERCNSLWIKYDQDGAIKMDTNKSSNSLHQNHKLIKRPGIDNFEIMYDVNGTTLIIEPSNLESYRSGCLVSCSQFGIGKVIGVVFDNIAIHFIQDGSLVRLLPISTSLVLERTVEPFQYPFYCLDTSGQFIDISIEKCLPFNIIPGDIIKIQNYFAICVGCGVYEDEPTLMFQTESMIKFNLGIGAFSKGKIELPYELIARIAYPGTTVKKLNDSSITLSVNTDDFVNSPLLPGDELMINGRQCIVCGIKIQDLEKKTGCLYVEYYDTMTCEPLLDSMKFSLYYRRLNVPTKVSIKSIKSNGTSKFAFIDLPHYKRTGVLPCDIVEFQSKKLGIIGIVDENKFLVNNMDSNEITVEGLKYDSNIKIISSVFDTEILDD